MHFRLCDERLDDIQFQSPPLSITARHVGIAELLGTAVVAQIRIAPAVLALFRAESLRRLESFAIGIGDDRVPFGRVTGHLLASTEHEHELIAGPHIGFEFMA